MLAKLRGLHTWRVLTSPNAGGESKLSYIQYLRAVAAFAIVLAHIVHEFPKFNGGMPEFLNFFASDLIFYEGGVDLFFVISGFIMMHMAEKYFSIPSAPKAFMVRRIIRIVPAYWFFTILFLVPALFFPHVLDRASFEPGNFVASFFFVPYHSEFFGVKPFMPAGWTLNYEMMFYIIFALSLFLNRAAGLIFIVGTICGLFLITPFLPQDWAITQFLAYPVLFEFLFGIGAYFAIKKNHRWAFIISMAAAAFLYDHYVGGRVTIGFGAAAVLVLCQMFIPDSSQPKPWPTRLFFMVGEASYILYLSNLFVIETISLLLRSAFGISHITTHLFILGGALGSICFALLFHYEIDDRVQRWLRTKTQPQTSLAAA